MRAQHLIAVAAVAISCAHAPSTKPAADRDRVARSNVNARLLIDVMAQFEPEDAAREGVNGIDDRISDFAPGHQARRRDALAKALAELQSRRQDEKDALVTQDLDIMIDAAKRDIKGSLLYEKLTVPYENLPRRLFGSVRCLLDAQIAPERRPAALARVKKYAGLEPGWKPAVTQLEAEIRDGLQKGLMAPARIEVERDLETAAPLLDGIEKLFRQYAIENSDRAVATLRRQLEEYLTFVQQEVLPKAREDFRIPPELYAFNLEDRGVDIQPAELAQMAHAAFTEYQGEMQKVAARIAAARHLPSSDYRDVIRELKKAQIPDDAVLAFYQHRLGEIEDIVRTQQLLTLPNRPARIRLGSPAENAQQPAPHCIAPRLIGNSGEQGEFVLPLSVPGKSEQKYDDFNYDAASWTLIAHEARPGHELQFSRMVESGVSLARALFAFNSVNVEGWGLYAEAITLPFMPDEGKLISLQLRMQRAARAFVDPELQMGKWTPESARQFLQHEVVLSPAFATEEVDRFTFRSPGQATAYFYGYTRLLELRQAAEKQLGGKFDQQRFHDLVLAQGLLPPGLMKAAVLTALQ